MTDDLSSSAKDPTIIVFGVGGAGGNAVRDLIGGSPDLKVVCANTDMQALRTVPPTHRLQLGRVMTAGLGAGGRPDIGRAAAEEALPEIRQMLEGRALCFIAAGMGGGTGSGATAVIARAAREMGVVTVCVATKPFGFEGKRRLTIAEQALHDVRGSVDALVTVCNQNVFRVIGAEITLAAALALSDSIIRDSARDIATLLAAPAIKRITRADLHTLLRDSGDAMIGFGECAAGQGRVLAAARAALDYPLLDGMGASARCLLVTVAAGQDLGLFEIEEAMGWLRERLPAASELMWSAVVDRALPGRVRVGVMAVGLTGIATSPVESADDAVDLVDALCADAMAAAPYPLYCAPLTIPPVPSPASHAAAVTIPALEGPPVTIDRLRALPEGVPYPAVKRIRCRTARPSLADRICDAMRDLTRRPILYDVPEPTPRATPVFRVFKPFAPASGRQIA